MEKNQIHLNASEQNKKIDELYEKLIYNRTDELDSSFQTQIAAAIRFYGKNLGKLEECDEWILKLARSFLLASSLNSVEWALRDSNAFLMMITILLLKRKDELVIRKVCTVLNEFTKVISVAHLRSLVKIHKKETLHILFKMRKVSTYYTQMKMLEMLHNFLKVLEDGGAHVICQERLFATSSPQKVEDAVNLFKDLDLKNFLITSRNFLEFYNKEFIKAPFIHSISCFLFSVNECRLEPSEVFVDFNMRNLSISFFVKSGVLYNDSSAFDFFVEVENCEVMAEPNRFSNPNHIELRLTKPQRSQVLDQADSLVVELSEIDSILLVVTEKTRLFWSTVYELFKKKTPLVKDNQTDLESMASFRTMNTTITTENLIKFSKQEPKEKVIERIKSNPVEGNRENISEDLFTDSMFDVLSTNNSAEQKSQPKVQVELRVPSKTPNQNPAHHEVRRMSLKALNQKSVYDEVPRDEESLPRFSAYSRQKRVERLSQTQTQTQSVVENTETTAPDTDLDWAPASTLSKKIVTKKQTPSKRATSYANKNKNGKMSRNSSEIDVEVKKAFGDEVFEDLPPVSASKKRATRQIKTDLKKLKKNSSFNKPTDDDIPTILIEMIPQQNKSAKKSNQKVYVSEVLSPLTLRQKTASNLKLSSKVECVAVSDGIDEISKVPATQKPKREAPIRSITERNQIIQARRAAVTEIKQDEKSRKRSSGSEIRKEQRDSKKSRTDFDSLLKDDKLTEREENTQEMAARVSKKRRRVSFNENVLVIKRSKSFENELDENESNMPVPPLTQNESDVKPLGEEGQKSFEHDQFEEPPSEAYTQHNPVPVKEVSYNFEALKDRHMLKKFIDQINESLSSQENSNQIVTNTQQIVTNGTSPVSFRGQKKSSPNVQIRTVQIQEINYTQQSNDDVEDNCEDETETNIDKELARVFNERVLTSIAPMLEEMKELEETSGQFSSEMKEKLHLTITNCRYSKALYQKRFDEIVKTLKLLYHLKRDLMPIQQQNNENFIQFRNTYEAAYQEAEKSHEGAYEKIKEIQERIEHKKNEILREVWQEYLDSIQDNFVSVIEKHRII